MNSKILATGSYLPKQIRTNADLEKMVDNAGIGKEVILLKQPVRFLMLDYFQLSSYQLQAFCPPTWP